MPFHREDTTTRHDPHVEVHVVTPDRWNDLVQLFERKGPRGGVPIPGHCWCMLWRDEQGPAGRPPQGSAEGHRRSRPVSRARRLH